jgi:hypothetical protein
MTTFKVKWVIDIEADSALDAVRTARRIQLDPTSTATYFTVGGSNYALASCNEVAIDLEDYPPEM